MLSTLLVVCGLLAVAPAGDERPADPAELARYAEISRGVGRDSSAQVRLALWCEAHGLSAERSKHLALALVSDPKNRAARGLLGLVAFEGRWKRPEAIAERVKADEALAARLAEYNARRARVRETAAAHWELALWCEQNGLEAEAKAHFTVVTRLDPAREAAWKRLECKKVGRRWVTEAQLAAEKEQAEARKQADRHWKPLLEKWRQWLGDKNRRGDALKALADVTDPRAVPSVWSVFVAGSSAYHDRAVQLLGQIDAPGASRALAFLAVFDDSADVRRAATETLRQRDPRDFGGLLVGLIRKPIKYEVKRVNGPGSTGVLLVQGKQYNVQRNYAAPGYPNMPLGPLDTVFPDVYGLPEVYRPLAMNVTETGQNVFKAIDSQTFDGERLGSVLVQGLGQAGRALGDRIAANLNAVVSQERTEAQTILNNPQRLPNGHMTTAGVPQIAVAQIPVGQMALATQANVARAQQQLDRDVQAIESQNGAIAQNNERVLAVLNPVSGQDLGPDPEAWARWLTDLRGYAFRSQASQDVPTFTQDIPVAAPLPPVTLGVIQGPVMPVPSHSCFAAGTPVRCLTGHQPIESIRVGDRVLVQDTDAGTAGLAYAPVVAVYHNPPNQTLRVSFGDEQVDATAIHRFWKAGKGWTMARDLKPGDVIRTLDGTARVVSVEPLGQQPVFNLEVASGHSFFVARRGILVHDNSLVEPVTHPFDGAAEIEVSQSRR
jgi:hypothetical protein